MRIVLDANVWVSALISDKGAPARILRHWQSGDITVLISAAILEELRRVLSYPRLRQYLPSDPVIAEFLSLLASQAVEVTPSHELSVIQCDPSDNRYLECAVAGRAAAIVSGDSHILELKEHDGIPILTPAEFLVLRELEK